MDQWNRKKSPEGKPRDKGMAKCQKLKLSPYYQLSTKINSK